VPLLKPRAPGLDEADDGRTGASGQMEDAHDRVGVCHAQGAAHEAHVLRVAEHRPSPDAARSRHDAVAGARPGPEVRGAHPGAKGLEGARVAQVLEALARLGDRLDRRLLSYRDGSHPARHRTAL
jgi:hypothetical protein